MHILTTEALASDIMNMVQESQDSQVTSISVSDGRTGTAIHNRDSSEDIDNYYAWSTPGTGLRSVIFTTSESPVVGDLTYRKTDSTFVEYANIVAINE